MRTTLRALAATVALASVSPAQAQAQAQAADDIALVGDASEVKGCQRLGEVEASSLLTGVMASQGRKRTVATLKAKAGELGATHVQVLSTNFSYASNNMMGIAYRCPAVAAEGEERAAPAP